ncbi:MAG: tRNA (N6-threonylcarbamoyladenosine(37)-N6)-methyltransferase TrmO [Firmicutes bacterium]|nr:tRNA (N6-threonylcarbamoyladenosine(37)-N6)-methyltransferase TrmO [Bacillota bacterium]
MSESGLQVIGHVYSDFETKFGIPRQSSIVGEALSRVVMEPEFRREEFFRGLEEFSHIWLIWQFSENLQSGWSPTVRPPRLGGNTRVGVFATRSPFRPNPVGLSCVRLERIEQDAELGTVLWVAGADLMNGTPVFDIKPYVPYCDAWPEARGGFAVPPQGHLLRVEAADAVLAPLAAEKRAALLAALAQDPRPAYQDDPERVYGMRFAGLDVRFVVDGGVLRVLELTPAAAGNR